MDRARGLGITIAADEIADAAQQVCLIESGCEQGQGRYFSDLITAEGTNSVVKGVLVSPWYLVKETVCSVQY